MIDQTGLEQVALAWARGKGILIDEKLNTVRQVPGPYGVNALSTSFHFSFTRIFRDSACYRARGYGNHDGSPRFGQSAFLAPSKA